MSDLKSLKKQLNRLKNEHYQLDKVILHMTAQNFDDEIKKDQFELNKLTELKKRKLSIRDEIFKIQKQLQGFMK